MKFYTFIGSVFLLQVTNCAHILVLWPYNMKSHYVVVEPLLQALQSRGHHLTVVSPFPQNQPLENFTEIDLSSLLPNIISSFSPQIIRENFPTIFQSVKFMVTSHFEMCKKALNDKRVLNLLNVEFDLVITEIFGSDCFNYFAYKMKVPVISWSTSRAMPWVADRMGFPDNPSYVAQYYLEHTAEMNFSNRLWNSFISVLAKVAYYHYSEVPTHRLVEDIFQERLPTMDEINKRTSLVFVNSHHSISQSRPFTPNVIEIAGINVKKVQPLPKDIKEILDNAKRGAIVMSFGSLVKMSALPKQTINIFMTVFAELSQTVILKCEEDILNLPSNVFIRKWLPQQDILAHPNIVAAVLHGGMASTAEAVHFAKPLVGVPFFADQFQNVRNIASLGAGVMLDIDSLTKEDFRSALAAVLNSSYQENMKQLSKRFRDRALSPLDTAVFWTEYVLRHRGAEHLRPASVSLPLYQYLLLDVLTVLAVGMYVVYLMVKRCCSLMTGRRKSKKTAKKFTNNLKRD